MLERIGVRRFEELLAPVPDSVRIGKPLNLPPALSELELLAEVDAIASTNATPICFAGAGIYDHFIPSAILRVISRPEFMTSYTPYQPEVAQGTLQVIYEFQTHVCRLTGMDVANASMYDGASAAAEAALTAISVSGRKKLIVLDPFHPNYLAVMRSYGVGFGAQFTTLASADGVSDVIRLADCADDHTAAIIVAQPNFFGGFEDLGAIAEIAHKIGALLIVVADAIALGITRTPADCGADIVVGEGQPWGIPMSYGGPLIGFYACKKELIRKLPGRLAARTVDVDGQTAYALTLQTREQHIKRGKATSNICTNQALCATAATIYLSLLGKQGLVAVAELAMERAHEGLSRISKLEGYAPAHRAPFFREFVLTTPVPACDVVAQALARGVLAGVDLGRWWPERSHELLIAFTEKRMNAEIDMLVAALRDAAVGARAKSGMIVKM